MHNYWIKLDSERNVITINYYGTGHYRTLLKSLEDLFTVYLPKDVRIVLDFSEVKSLLMSYSQISNFRQGLRSIVVPHRTGTKIAIINAPNDTWGGRICSSRPLTNTDFLEFDLRCYGAHQKTEAHRWF